MNKFITIYWKFSTGGLPEDFDWVRTTIKLDDISTIEKYETKEIENTFYKLNDKYNITEDCYNFLIKQLIVLEGPKT